jgi:hypothetical protein
MSKPSLEDFLQSSARWIGDHKGIRYELSWHGLSEYNEQGTWCWYLHLFSEQFNANDWAKLRLDREDKQMLGPNWHRHYNYDGFPDLDAHGGWTFGELDIYLGKDGKEYEHVKIGCDYAHLWDRENGYWQGREAIEQDAKRSIDLLCEMFPARRQRCGYSGKYDDLENFYTARNGKLIHNSHRGEFSDEHWPQWQPADTDIGASA